jgi:hypothetical protein
MNWARAKTLLIMLLFAVNLVLGGILLYRETQGRTQEWRALEDLCALLQQNGLTARPDQIPSTLALTFDVELSAEEGPPEAHPAVRGLPVWGMAAGSGVTPVTGVWLWDEALPIDNRAGFSAGHCLLIWADGQDGTGTLEECELGFIATSITPDVLRLRPCWRFVISGKEVFFPAA